MALENPELAGKSIDGTDEQLQVSTRRPYSLSDALIDLLFYRFLQPIPPIVGRKVPDVRIEFWVESYSRSGFCGFSQQAGYSEEIVREHVPTRVDRVTSFPVSRVIYGPKGTK